jgi:YgiT-type zinc finger domain-containing protein
VGPDQRRQVEAGINGARGSLGIVEKRRVYMEKETGESLEFFCSSCHIGKLQPHRTTFTHWHAGDLVVVPGVQAWRCDYCGDAFFDNEALGRLVLLLGPETTSSDTQQRRARGLEGGSGEGLSDRRRA